MSRLFLIAVLAGVGLGIGGAASAQPALESPSASRLQDAPQAKPGRPTPIPQPAPPAVPTPQPTPPAVPMPMIPVPSPPPPTARLVNVQLEFTITDQAGSGTPDKKSVSMMTSNMTWGRIRATGTARPKASGPLAVVLNVDARPMITTGDAIQTEITIEYRPVGSTLADEPTRIEPTVLNQSLTVLLQSGKPMVISQAADPISDRKIVVEVKATVLK